MEWMKCCAHVVLAWLLPHATFLIRIPTALRLNSNVDDLALSPVALSSIGLALGTFASRPGTCVGGEVTSFPSPVCSRAACVFPLQLRGVKVRRGRDCCTCPADAVYVLVPCLVPCLGPPALKPRRIRMHLCKLWERLVSRIFNYVAIGDGHTYTEKGQGGKLVQCLVASACSHTDAQSDLATCSYLFPVIVADST